MKTKLLLLLAMSIGLVSSVWAEDVEISNASELVAFAERVNDGETSLNAVLTDDIDMTGVEWLNPIGKSEYTGHFNGQGNTISGLVYTTNQDNHGLFGKLAAGALVENFTISGTITNASYDAVGVVGYSSGTTVNIKNIISYLELSNSGHDKKIGGIIGNGNQGTTNIDRCAFYGTINTTGKANVAGIAGYIQNNKSTYINFSNCLFAGEITTTVTNAYCGGVVGYIGANNTRYTIKNCLSLGTVTAPVAGGIVGYARNKGAGSSNNYILSGGNTYGKVSDNCSATDNLATEVTSEQFVSGELCFLLNGSVSGGENWFQTLNDDKYPTPNGSDKVYANGSYNCDGVTPKEGSTLTYGNTDEAIVAPHDFVGGICTVCNAVDETWMTANDEGNFEIGSEAQLVWFASYVNQKDMEANAVLTDDITLTKDWKNPIGNWVGSAAYKGHFDGQGYKITGLAGTSTQNYFGLFGVISTGALIENFSIYGDISTTFQCAGGVAGYARDTNPTIFNVHSYVNITNTLAGGRQGGILGASMNGTVNVDRCTYSGTFIIDNVNGNYGGIVGYVNNNTAATMNVTNCLFDGTVENTVNSECGGIVGYIGANPQYTVKNCLSIGTIVAPVGGQICGAVKGNGVAYDNNYYKGEAANGSTSTVDKPATSVTPAQLSSGEVAYKLGEAWGQLLESDPYPTPSYDVKVSYVGDAGYATLYDETIGYELIGDVKAYTATTKGNWLILAEAENVPAKTPVILQGTYYNKIEQSLPALNQANELVGIEDATVADGSQYVLAKPEGEEVGFYQAIEDTTIPGGKAILVKNAGVKSFFFNSEDATAITNVNGNGNNGAIYNMAGQKLSKVQKGINIVNGKKVMY